jgi:hypothetical protein
MDFIMNNIDQEKMASAVLDVQESASARHQDPDSSCLPPYDCHIGWDCCTGATINHSEFPPLPGMPYSIPYHCGRWTTYGRPVSCLEALVALRAGAHGTSRLNSGVPLSCHNACIGARCSAAMVPLVRASSAHNLTKMRRCRQDKRSWAIGSPSFDHDIPPSFQTPQYSISGHAPHGIRQVLLSRE